jgi:hypothetical protein
VLPGTDVVPSATTERAPLAAATPFPIFSSYFTGATPFHKTFAQLQANGITFRGATVAANYWTQGLGVGQPLNPATLGPALYVVHAGNPGYTFSCPAYGTCNASGLTVYYPPGAAPSASTDHHLVSFDPIHHKAEIDGWGGYAPNEACQLTAGSPTGTATCSWGGTFPFSGSGMAYPKGTSANAGGYAFGLFQVTAQELLNLQINHALGIVSSCLDATTVYPSTHPGTDSACSSNLEPNAVYGDMIHLKNAVDVTSLSSNMYCQAILTAFQKYGAYTADTNVQYGIGLEFETAQNPIYPAGNNPWLNTIYPSMESTGDAILYNGEIYHHSCLQNVTAADIDVVQIAHP